MTTAEMIKHAVNLLALYQGLRRVVGSRGISPDDFDEQVRTEAKRLDGYGSSVSDAVADVFAGK